MNIILCLHITLREPISNYIKEAMRLPQPIICLDLLQLAGIYKKSLPAMFIISSSLYADPSMKKKLGELLNKENHARVIIVPDSPNLFDHKFTQKLKAAIIFCLDEPFRIMISICLAGITIAEHCHNPSIREKMTIGIKRIRMEDVKYGHPYNIITQCRPYQRYIYQSKNEDTILAAIDHKLTPNEYKGRIKLHEIPKKDILSIMKICYELRQF